MAKESISSVAQAWRPLLAEEIRNNNWSGTRKILNEANIGPDIVLLMSVGFNNIVMARHCIEHLIKQEAALPLPHYENGSTLLIQATILNNLEMVQNLRQLLNTDVNEVDKDGKTALIYATIYRRAGIARYLISEGADIGYTLVHIAGEGGDDMINWLLTVMVDKGVSLEKYDSAISYINNYVEKITSQPQEGSICSSPHKLEILDQAINQLNQHKNHRQAEEEGKHYSFFYRGR